MRFDNETLPFARAVSKIITHEVCLGEIMGNTNIGSSGGDLN